MIDEVQITISAYNFQRLCELHDKWKKRHGSGMAEQDINYILCRLLDEEEKKG